MLLGYQLVVNTTEDKIKCVPGSGSVDDLAKARFGFNPYPDIPPKPKIKKGIKKTKAMLKAIRTWNEYDKHKDDMTVQGYAMGPDFKRGYVSYDEVEVVDFYQIICFLLRIPAGFHSGSWQRIEGMLAISAAHSVHFNGVLLGFLCSFISILNLYHC